MRKTIYTILLIIISFGLSVSQSANLLSPLSKFTMEQCKPKLSSAYTSLIVRDTTFNALLINKQGIASETAGNVYSRNSALVIGLTKDTVGIESNYFVTVALTVKFKKLGSTRMDSTKVKLSIDYKKQNGTNYKAKDYFVLDSVIWSSITLDTLDTDGSMSFGSRLFDLEFSIMGEQDLQPVFTEEVPDLNINTERNKGNYTITWDPLLWAKSYDLEWQFIDGYDTSVPSYRNNSTRVNIVSATQYVVPMISAKGKFRVRIRAVGAFRDGSIFRGPWTSDSFFDSNSKEIRDESVFEQDKKPWQYNASYAEDGLRKDVVSFSDGSGRQRQSITKLNSGVKNKIVGESYYDHQGRPVVYTLPSPIPSSISSSSIPSTSNPPDINYIPGFNITSGGEVFDRRAFDMDVNSDGCAPGTMSEPMSIFYGSSRYYSPKNTADPRLEPHAPYIPNAEGYPYYQVEYTPDNTNRIKRQGMAGKDFQLGSGHETRYYYSVPSQRELFRMFGHNVGKASHYTKVLMEDPNGQLYVTYANAKGQTIASALAGNHTNTNIQALTDIEPPLQDRIDVIAQSNSIKDNNAHSEAAQTFFVEDNRTLVNINYRLSATQMRAMICAQNVCYDCPKRLILSLRDNCGGTQFSDTITIGRLPDGNIANCESIPEFTFDRSLTLQRGEYYLYKSLSIIEQARDGYVADYIARDTACYNPNIPIAPCITGETKCVPCEYDISSAGKIIRKEGNNPFCKRSCPNETSKFDANLFNSLCMDVAPRGQYGAIDVTHAKWRVSFFNTNRTIGPNTTLWTNNYRSREIVFLDLNGQVDAVDVQDAEVSVYDGSRTFLRNGRLHVLPNDIIDLNYLSRIWKDSWSESLVVLHPEYAYLMWNNLNVLSINFDEQMNNTLTWEEAQRKGFVQNNEVIDFSYLDKDPFFRTNSAQRDRVMDSLNTVAREPFNINVYHMAKVAMFCNAPINQTDPSSMRNCIERIRSIFIADQSKEAKDFAWDFIKAKYQKDKQALLDELREANLSRGSSHILAGASTYVCLDQKTNNDCGLCNTEMRRIPLNDSLANCISRVRHVRCVTETTIPRADGTGRTSNFEQIAAENALNMISNCGISVRGKYLWDLMNALITHPEGSRLTEEGVDITGLPPFVIAADLTNNFPNRRSSRYFWTGQAVANLLLVTITDEEKVIQASFTLKKDTTISWKDIKYLGCMTMYKRNSSYTDLELDQIGFTALDYGSRFKIKVVDIVNFDFSIGAVLREAGQFAGMLKKKANFVGKPGVCNLCLPGLSPRVVPADPCAQNLNRQQNEIFAAKVERARRLKDSITQVYNIACLVPGTEQLTVTKSSAIYHYTLFYYNQAGHLTKTVPPMGVKIITDFSRMEESHSVYPTHINALSTSYTYNSLGGKLTKITPDGGITKWAYDVLGRPLVAQDAFQASDRTHGYLMYDKIGRVEESGVIKGGTSSISEWLRLGKINYNAFKGAIEAKRIDKQEINKIYYDAPAFVTNVAAEFTARKQVNLRNRVASSAYFVNGADLASNKYQHALHYSYNIVGHLTEMVQDFPELTNLAGLPREVAANHRFKKVRYKFDLITGKIKEEAYQPDRADQFYHWRKYDADNRVISVSTGRSRYEPGDRVDHDISYKYYTHGNIARAELGEEKVQGLDLTYTINGWLKGINKVGTNDPGNDKENGYLRDVYQQESNYFRGDYKPIGGSMMESPSTYNNQYNGNISAIQNTNLILDKEGVFHLHKYTYDQLNRLTASQRNDNDAYRTTTAYDKNGNIDRMSRRDGSGSIFDELTYEYNKDASDGKINNRLRYISDGTSFRLDGNSDLFTQPVDNYVYDAKGRLEEDKAEDHKMSWLYSDKIKQISEGGQTVDFYYDALGRRVFKKNNQTNIGELTIRDFSGKVLAEYEIKNTNIYLKNIPLYADNRIGAISLDTLINNPVATSRWSQYRGAKVYELKNQVGDINALVSDRRINDGANYSADVRKATEYFPFGMIMPGRDSSTTDYRYGFQGMEQDDDLKGKGNSISTEFRQYDPRVGRWLSVDPKAHLIRNMTPYNSFANNPIAFTDPRGDIAWWIIGGAVGLASGIAGELVGYSITGRAPDPYGAALRIAISTGAGVATCGLSAAETFSASVTVQVTTRIVLGVSIEVGANALQQEVSINTGEEDEFSGTQLVVSALFSGAGGAIEARLASNAQRQGIQRIIDNFTRTFGRQPNRQLLLRSNPLDNLAAREGMEVVNRALDHSELIGNSLDVAGNAAQAAIFADSPQPSPQATPVNPSPNPPHGTVATPYIDRTNADGSVAERTIIESPAQQALRFRQWRAAQSLRTSGEGPILTPAFLRAGQEEDQRQRQQRRE